MRIPGLSGDATKAADWFYKNNRKVLREVTINMGKDPAMKEVIKVINNGGRRMISINTDKNR